ncbi:ATP-binding protein [Pendulispora albinea]|uniref:histidine kinase n=1 Tax=Pendulispora albinea TaxID=2741071 RepID=A0ABZ2LTV6_9BACT
MLPSRARLKRCARINGLENRLRRAEERLALARAEAEAMQHASRRFQETGIIGVLYWRSDGAITYSNDAYLDMLGYTREEFERDGLDWRKLTPHEFAGTDVQAFIEMNERGYCRPYEKAYRAKDGRIVPIQIGSAFWEGSKEGGVCWVLDISERKRAEAERDCLLAAEQCARREAESANAAKDQFLAVVSHELRTPLTAILGWAKLLRAGPVSPEMRERALATIERNAQLQARLIDDILDVSRIIAGKLVLDVSSVPVADVVHAAADSLRPSYREKKVDLWVEIEPELPFILADANRLQQVIWNLVQNALKFTPAGGHVHVRAFRSGDTELSIEVTDTGQGIKPEFLPRLFERFQQADTSATRVHRGLGLGLAIVDQLVALHGGSVRAESDGMGRGAKLCVRLPIGPVSSMRRVARASKGPQVLGQRLDDMHVLVVDDEPDIRELIAQILSDHGANVVLASSVAEAIDLAHRHRLDAILSDIAMPQADGFELVRRLKSVDGSNGRSPAMCAVTAMASPLDRERIAAAGFDAVLSKPVLPERLLEIVYRLTRVEPPPSVQRRAWMASSSARASSRR